ncbi:hypothetical protein [Micromonospora sp. NPDC050200]|uniref:LppU/SCO3897 family protein n=1 Tax=Micromonospora sp. NPDC050200 TaxID=3155664 RepID=UPI0033E64A4D
MTSEGQHRPGQEPDQVPPGAGGPAPYGDRHPQQDAGYGDPAAPDLGWAPPPPAGRPDQSAPAWATQDQPPAWGAAQPPQQGEPAQPGQWATPSQPAWAAQSDQPAAWSAAPVPGQPAGQGEPAQPAWAQPEQAAPAWAQPESGVRGAARVPQPAGQPQDAWSTPADPAGSGGWNAGAGQQEQAPAANGWGAAPHDEPARSGGWNTTAQDDPAQSGGWNAGGQQEPANGWGAEAASQQDDPARSGGWTAASHQDDAPRSAGRASVPVPQQPEPAAPAWGQPENGARTAAQVPPAPDAWSTQDDAARSGGWNATQPAQDEPAGPTGWNAAGQNEPAGPGGWNTAAQDDSVHSGGWRTAPQEDERSPQPWDAGAAQTSGRWDAREEQQSGDGWGAAAPARDDQRPDRDWPAAEEPARTGSWGGAAMPGPDDRPEVGGWTPPEQPPRATASVAVPDNPPAWGANAENPPQWAGADRPAVPDAEPWAAEEAWGRAEAEPAQRSTGDAWEPKRADETPIYQPGPAPGISPANAVPLPPQEPRVPGASLAATPPADYVPPAQFGGAADQSSFEPAGREGAPPAYEPERSGWGPAEESQSPAGPVVPGPRTSPEAGGAEAGATGRASASASVPLASRVMPPIDQAVPPGGTGAPQPRVYGRPARPEPVDEPVEEYDGQQAQQDSPPRFDDQQRFDEPDRLSGFGAEAPSSAPPTSPAAPPAFPGAIPAFADPARNNRPMNGNRPHGPTDRPAEPFGGPPAGGPPAGAVPGYGHPAHDPAHGGTPSPFPPAGPPFPPAGQPFPPAGQPFPPAEQSFPPANQPGPGAWHQDPEPEQGRFDTFKPDAEPKAEQPVPKVRNGRVLAIVLIAAVLILAIPLGLLSLLGKIGADDKPAQFSPAVGSCVKQSGNGATAANCGEQGAFTVVSKVDAKDKCADPAQPHVVLPGSGADRVLCLKPAAE